MKNSHGGNIDEIKRNYKIKDLVDFSANINPLGLSKTVKEAMINAIEDVVHYPDITYLDLINRISEFENVEKNNIFLGNGAAEVIFNIVRGLKPKRALLYGPSFSEYREALSSVDCNIDYYVLKDKCNLDLGILDMINKETDIIFICNPNNPTGALCKRDMIEEIIKASKRKDVTVVIDESFLEFVRNSKEFTLINSLKHYDNVIIVKSLTKIFAFPGIRLGYGLTKNKEYLEKINKNTISWSVNTIANKAGIAALKESLYIKNTISFVEEENKFLFNNLSLFKDLKVFKGYANFIFFKTFKNIDLKEELLKYGILIRSCENYIGLDMSYYRVAVRSREENIKLIKSLQEIVN